MIYELLADLVLILHGAYISYVVLGQVLILVGVVCRWQWIRNLWFRTSHLVMILIVALESIFGMVCPLTTWEDQLRVLAGQAHDETGFIARMLRNLFFFSCQEWIFTTSYITFAAAVLLTFWLAPPRRAAKDLLANEAREEPALRNFDSI